MIKKTSKITLLSAVLLAGVVNAQEFYTCVPKKSWWIDVVKSGQKKSWDKIIHLTPSSGQSQFKQYLQPGRYRVKAAAGGGQEEIKEFYLTKVYEFKACVGRMGSDEQENGNGGKGGGGMGYNGVYRGGDGGVGGETIQDSMWGKEGTNGNIGGGYGGAGQAGKGGEKGLVKVLVIDGADGQGGYGGTGCYGGGGGGGGSGSTDGVMRGGGGQGGGGGSYFQVADVELILKGGNGERYREFIPGESFNLDGYVIIEKME